MDGAAHGTPEQQERDALLTRRLEAEGFRVIRFTNDQVLGHMVSVIAVLEELVAEIERREGDRSREIWSQKR